MKSNIKEQKNTIDYIRGVVAKFLVKGDIKSIEPYGEGHINQTFLVTTTKAEYILQKISLSAFPNVDMLMANINIATQFLRNKDVETLDIIFSKKGKLVVREKNDAFRIYKFFNNSICYQSLHDYEQIEEVAAAFGQLHKYLADLDPALLGEIIPQFHDTKKRYNDFLNACEIDKIGRLEKCLKQARVINKLSSYYGLIVDGIEEGSIKLHVTHNDPKINNVLFDKDTHKVKCVIDLDTVMPGSVLYDFGDAHRSLFIGSHEDERNLENIEVDLEIYRSYLKGYYKEAKEFLTPREIELLPIAPFLLSIECGMRFLEDYLKGDMYFHTDYPDHNLVRARTQIRLAQIILSKQNEMQEITKEIIQNLQ